MFQLILAVATAVAAPPVDSDQGATVLYHLERCASDDRAGLVVADASRDDAVEFVAHEPGIVNTFPRNGALPCEQLLPVRLRARDLSARQGVDPCGRPLNLLRDLSLFEAAHALGVLAGGRYRVVDQKGNVVGTAVATSASFLLVSLEGSLTERVNRVPRRGRGRLERSEDNWLWGVGASPGGKGVVLVIDAAEVAAINRGSNRHGAKVDDVVPLIEPFAWLSADQCAAP